MSIITRSLARGRARIPHSTYFTRRQAWVVRILAPSLLVGLALTGFAAPANAADATGEVTTPAAAAGSSDPATSDPAPPAAQPTQPTVDVAPGTPPVSKETAAPVAPTSPPVTPTTAAPVTPPASSAPSTPKPSTPPVTIPATPSASVGSDSTAPRARTSVKALSSSPYDGGSYPSNPPATVTIVKKVVNAAGVSQPSEVAGWAFSAASDAFPYGPQTVTTDSSGTASFSVPITGVSTRTITLTETTTRDGYVLLPHNGTNAICRGNSFSPTVTNIGDAGFSFVVAAGQDITCTVTNQYSPATWEVSKTSVPASGTTVQPGDYITYTLKLTHTGGSTPSSLVLTDDLSNVFSNAHFADTMLSPSSGFASFAGNLLKWTITDFTQSAELSYRVQVNANAYNVHIRNVLTVPPGGTCVGSCTTDNPTPHWNLTKSSDPATGSLVQPGQDVTYTLTASNDSGGTVSGATATDNLADVLDNATLKAPLPHGLTLDATGKKLVWAIGTLEPGAPPTSISYTVTVNQDASGVSLNNVVTPSLGGSCPSYSNGLPDDSTQPRCDTVHRVPKVNLGIVKTHAAISGVDVGDSIDYSLLITNNGDGAATGVTVSDPLPTGLSLVKGSVTAPSGWTVTEANGTLTAHFAGSFAAAATASIRYSALVGASAASPSIENTACVSSNEHDVDGSDNCSTDTTPRTPKVNLAIVKTHGAIAGGAVDSDKGSTLDYILAVTNKGDAPATGVTVSDPLPAGLTVVPGTVVSATGWTVTVASGTLTASYAGSFAAGATATITYTALVGTLSRSGTNVPFPDIVNTACVSSAERDADGSDNCSTDSTKVSSVAITAQALCLADAPVFQYSITPYNLKTAPTVAVVWWTTDGYAHRDPSIRASDKAALLANGAQQVNYVAVPAGWTNGQTISGTQLWPGAAVDANGNPTAWPGWRQLASGQWVIDPSAPFYNLRGAAVVEVRINPTTASMLSYPPASPDCNATPPTFTPAGQVSSVSSLAKTGSDDSGPMILGGMLLVVGILITLWIRRRRDDGQVE